MRNNFSESFIRPKTRKPSEDAAPRNRPPSTPVRNLEPDPSRRLPNFHEDEPLLRREERHAPIHIRMGANMAPPIYPVGVTAMSSPGERVTTR